MVAAFPLMEERGREAPRSTAPAPGWTADLEDALGMRGLSNEELRALTGWQRILYHLKRYETITPMKAWQLYGVYRLGSVIFRLRRGIHCHRKYEINNDEAHVQNKYGEPVTCACYRLVQP